ISHLVPCCSKFTCTRACGPFPSTFSTTPSPNLPCRTRAPRRIPGGGGSSLRNLMAGAAGCSRCRIRAAAAARATCTRGLTSATMSGYLFDEARRRGMGVHAMHATLLGVGEKQMLHRARHADVAQAPFLLQRLQVRHAAVVREESFLHPAEKDELEFETLCHVQRHHLHAVLSGIGLSLTGLQYRVRQEGMERRQVDIGALRGEAAGGADELREVLEARFAARHLAAGLGARRALIRLLPAVMLDEPALLQHEIDLLVQGEPFGLPRQPVDEIMEAAYGARRPAALLRLAASDGRFP